MILIFILIFLWICTGFALQDCFESKYIFFFTELEKDLYLHYWAIKISSILLGPFCYFLYRKFRDELKKTDYACYEVIKLREEFYDR